MTCKRGHENSFLIKFIERKTKCCSFILAYRQKEGLGSNALMCYELVINKPIPKGWIALT
jgi:hypothetical protein